MVGALIVVSILSVVHCGFRIVLASETNRVGDAFATGCVLLATALALGTFIHA